MAPLAAMILPCGEAFLRHWRCMEKTRERLRKSWWCSDPDIQAHLPWVCSCEPINMCSTFPFLIWFEIIFLVICNQITLNSTIQRYCLKNYAKGSSNGSATLHKSECLAMFSPVCLHLLGREGRVYTMTAAIFQTTWLAAQLSQHCCGPPQWQGPQWQGAQQWAQALASLSWFFFSAPSLILTIYHLTMNLQRKTFLEFLRTKEQCRILYFSWDDINSTVMSIFSSRLIHHKCGITLQYHWQSLCHQVTYNRQGAGLMGHLQDTFGCK